MTNLLLAETYRKTLRLTGGREWKEFSTMGKDIRPDNGDVTVGSGSDWQAKINGYRPYYFYAYFNDSKRLYHIGYYDVKKTKAISSYKDFYFGTLNHR